MNKREGVRTGPSRLNGKVGPNSRDPNLPERGGGGKNLNRDAWGNHVIEILPAWRTSFQSGRPRAPLEWDLARSATKIFFTTAPSHPRLKISPLPPAPPPFRATLASTGSASSTPHHREEPGSGLQSALRAKGSGLRVPEGSSPKIESGFYFWTPSLDRHVAASPSGSDPHGSLRKLVVFPEDHIRILGLEEFHDPLDPFPA